MSVLTQTRRAKGTYPCASCKGVIFPGELHDRKVAKAGGKYASTRHHILCPIPTRPVQKHFSEAGEKMSGIPWPIYVKIALIALVAGALAAVVIFMTGVA